jgi:hypothetical protein
VTINKSEKLQAIACKGAASSTVTGPVDYTLSVTPAAIVGAPTAACPSVVTVGFDMASTNTSLGGPTPAASICYSPVPIPAGTACATAGGGFAAGGITCFTPTTANPTTPVSLSEGTIYTLACKANFTGTRVTLPFTVAPYAPPTITVDGTLNATEWSAELGDQFPSTTMGDTGGFTFGKTTAAGDTLFFSEGGFTAAAGTHVIFYLRDAATATAGTTTTTRLLGANALPFRAQYAIEVDTNGATGCAAGMCAVTVYKNAGGGTAATWTLLAPAPAVAAAVTAHAVEASILLSAFPGAAIGDAFDIVGEVYDGAALSGRWSATAGGAATYLSDYSSLLCSAPLLSLH